MSTHGPVRTGARRARSADVHISLLLADSAQVNDGKVHALGLGWTATGLPTPPLSVVTFLDLDWSSEPTKADVVVELVDADGHVVLVPTPNGLEPISGGITVECPHAQTPDGPPTRVPLVVSFPPGLPLRAGERYQWRARSGAVSAEQTFLVNR